MQTSTVSEALVITANPNTARTTTQQLRLRNARARKRLERRCDRKLLRMHIEEVWSRPDA
jgi:hypothetical protein